jgi:CHAT domain-containing protein
VAGARSVIGSLWPVPDESTSLLMYMFHHYLHRNSPAHALREAQLWMLHEDRTTPADMLDELVARMPSIDPRDLLSWAGFSHFGQ